jgi:hypothetical protein
LPFRISRLGAGLCGNTRAELAPTRYREGSQDMRVVPSPLVRQHLKQEPSALAVHAGSWAGGAG